MVEKLAQSESEIQEFFKYQKFEKTRMGSILVEGLKLGKRFLDYKGNPFAMYRDRDMRPFCDLFIEYCQGKISLSEAQKKNASMVIDWNVTNGTAFHEDTIKAFFETRIGKRFDDVIQGFQSNDKEVTKESAILIVTVFKEALHRYGPIKRLMEEADRKGDLKFKEDIGKAYRTIPEDMGVYRDTVVFIRMHEDFIQGHSFRETVDLAKKWGLKIEEDSFKKYLHRHGVKKESPGRPRGRDNHIDSEIETLLNTHRKDFDRYLFGDEGGIDGFKKMLNDIEKKLFDLLKKR